MAYRTLANTAAAAIRFIRIRRGPDPGIRVTVERSEHRLNMPPHFALDVGEGRRRFGRPILEGLGDKLVGGHGPLSLRHGCGRGFRYGS